MADATGWLIGQFGYAGIFLLTLLETVFPPLPSELIIPLAAFHARQQAMSLTGVAIAGTLGSMTGNLLWYALAWRFGLARFRCLVKRHGRWLTADWNDIARAEHHFIRHGALFVFAGRLLPALRTFISIPAGLARMPPARYLLWSTLGTAGWTTALAYAGWLLGARYQEIGAVLGPLSAMIIAPFAVWYLWRLYKSFRP